MSFQIIRKKIQANTEEDFVFSGKVKQWVAGVSGFDYIHKAAAFPGDAIKAMDLKLIGNVYDETITLRAVCKFESTSSSIHIDPSSYVNVTIVAWINTEQDNINLYTGRSIPNGLYSSPTPVGNGVIERMQPAIGGFSFDYGEVENKAGTRVIRVASGCSHIGNSGYISSIIDVRSGTGATPGQNIPATIDGILLSQISDQPGLIVGAFPNMTPGEGSVSISLPPLQGRRVTSASILLQDFYLCQNIGGMFPIYSINLDVDNIEFDDTKISFRYNMDVSIFVNRPVSIITAPSNATFIYVLALENL